ncbi:syntaxin [Forsythia ovata]|uniref:Syntaxin n=1 Tax=Forsythia ovata TaxID=205694 RepID=A0ABD1NVH2_9LAMI
MEIQELTTLVKQDITALNSAVVDIQLLCNSRNGSSIMPSDTTTQFFDDLKNRLMSATKEFKEVLTMRTEVNNNFVHQQPSAAKPTVSTSASPALAWASGAQSSSHPFSK